MIRRRGMINVKIKIIHVTIITERFNHSGILIEIKKPKVCYSTYKPLPNSMQLSVISIKLHYHHSLKTSISYDSTSKSVCNALSFLVKIQLRYSV